MYYNYANVQVKCYKKDLNSVVSNALIIASTMKYNDDVIKNILADKNYTGTDEQVSIFNKDSVEGDVLDIVDDIYTGDESKDYDPDIIIKR